MPNLMQAATNKPLTNVSLAYNNKSLGFIHDQVAPAVPVILDSADIYSYGADNLRIVNNIRSQGGNSNTIDWSVSKAAHYKLEDHVLKSYLTQEDYENAEKPIMPQTDTTEILTEVLQVAKEYSIASAMQSTSTMTNNVTLTGSDQWSDYDNSDPIDDMVTGSEAVLDATAKIPNTVIIARDAMMKLIYHPKIKDLFPGAARITAGMLQDIIMDLVPGIDRVLVGNAMYNNANKGASLNLSRIWSKTCIIAYIERRPTLKSQTLANTYQYKKPRTVQLFTASGTKDVDLLDRESDLIRVKDKYDQVLVNVNCGYLIKDAIA